MLAASWHAENLSSGASGICVLDSRLTACPGPHLARAAWSSSSFLASCILSSAICACSSAIWSLRSVESPSSFRRVFSSSCRCFSSLRRRSVQEQG